MAQTMRQHIFAAALEVFMQQYVQMSDCIKSQWVKGVSLAVNGKAERGPYLDDEKAACAGRHMQLLGVVMGQPIRGLCRTDELAECVRGEFANETRWILTKVGEEWAVQFVVELIEFYIH